WIAARGKPERLGPKQTLAPDPLPLESRYILSEDRSAHTLRLTYRKAATEPGQVTASIPLPPGFHWRYPVAVRDDGLFFALDNAPLSTSGLRSGAGFVSAYHPPQKPILRRGINPPSALMTRLCRLPLSGGPLETIITPTSRLMATSLTTRQTDQVADRMPLTVLFLPDATALYWQVGISRPGRPPHTELWRYAPGLAHPVRLTEDWNSASHKPPVALGGRLYWLEDRQEETPETAHDSPLSELNTSVITRTDLVSAREDGTDRRLLVSLPPTSGLPALSNLQEHRGRLYLLLKAAERKRNTPVTATYLCRLDPGRQNPLVKLLRLPDTSAFQRFQEGYVYYAVPEVDAPWFGNRPVTTRTILYRWKLPE